MELRATGPRCTICYGRPHYHECLRRIQQYTTSLAARLEGPCRTESIAGANYSQRDGAVVSLADLAVLYPQRTVAFYFRGRGSSRYRGGPVDHLQGLYYALLEGRFVFDFVHEGNLDAANLQKYRALLIPNAAFLSDAQCEAIRQYVKNGGSLLATFETSRYNEWGEPRADFQLADLFGAH